MSVSEVTVVDLSDEEMAEFARRRGIDVSGGLVLLSPGVGDGTAVRDLLAAYNAAAHHGGQRLGRQVLEAVAAAVSSVQVGTEQYRRVLEAIEPPGPVIGMGAYKQARRLADVWASFAAEFPLLTSAQVAAQSGSTAKNAGSTASRWASRGEVFAVPAGDGSHRYPAFQFDQAGRPRPVIADVIRVLEGVRDRRALALWFVSNNGWLDGARPVDLLADQPAAVIEAAQQLAQELTGGPDPLDGEHLDADPDTGSRREQQAG
ncbi:hypothetical protein [Nakamurella endophytica]|uniref:DUF2384 domain-containing protein n=1 Tax=Nakamurella endophytica TaxID=1748367 RepID=A0A917WMZ9_9ACTN|nr:hypothetical protein [Nakamurella endophytica]GGM16268.1 hypothetical protein GCM10011594_40400 [Nakamurella endophytica]